ncbi:extracellular solute-binding protein [bacterium]|nr:extracellular solute-binding protein [bacterium]
MRRTAALFTAAVLVFSSCSGDDGPDTIRVYTSVTQGTVDAVLEAFGLVNPGVEVVVFRAPTGELNARIAAEQREGGIQADVLWLTDPLSMQAYDASGVLASWDPVGAAALDPAFASERFWGTRLLDVIIVHGPDVDPAPVSWTDLVATAASGGVAMPDPGFAGSAFAALGYFALTEGYGMGFYEDLAGAGAVQVPAPGDVVTGVAEGRYAAGITLSAIAPGSGHTMTIGDPSSTALRAIADSVIPAAYRPSATPVTTSPGAGTWTAPAPARSS